MRDAPTWDHPTGSEVLSSIFAAPVSGREVNPRGRHACELCRRAVGFRGRLLCPGYLTCAHASCETVRGGDLNACFPTPYGPATSRSFFSSFTSVVDLPSGRLVVRRGPVMERADLLVAHYLELLRWQEAFDAYCRSCYQTDYERGVLPYQPPRRLQDVLTVRADGCGVRLDPTRGVPGADAVLIRRAFEEGPEVLVSP